MLDSGLLCKLKEEAVRRGKTLQDCLNECLRFGMQVWIRKQKSREPVKLPAVSMGKFLVDPADRNALMDLLGRP